jgi:hypothetical protein
MYSGSGDPRQFVRWRDAQYDGILARGSPGSKAEPGKDLMAALLLIAGIASLLAGLLAMALGIPVKEFSFGNTLILVGAIGVCTGLILLGLWTVVRELRNISRGLGGGASVKSRLPSRPSAAPRLEPEGDLPFSREQNQEPKLQPYALDPEPAVQPWRDEPVAHTPDDSGEPSPTPTSGPKPRRNLLFSSSSRRERERAQARAEPSAQEESPPDLSASFSAPDSQADEASPGTVDNPWPRARSGDGSPHRRSNRPPSSFTDPSSGGPPADRQGTAARSEDRPGVTVLKSGTVDGMAYSLYSDGSIEAQMPEGMMRFGSINELRAHLEHRP